MSATVEELEALPEGAIVKDDDGDVWVKRQAINQYCKPYWACDEYSFYTETDECLVNECGPVTILAPQGFDYSMCARLVQKPGYQVWRLEHPNGDPVTNQWYNLEYAQQLGYPVKDTRTTVQRVADILEDLDLEDLSYERMAERLAELGLLTQEGE